MFPTLNAKVSTDQERVRLLLPGEEVQVLDELRKVNRYFHVITAQNEEGWIWSPNVTVDLDRDLEVVTAPSEIFHGCPMEGSATTASARALNVQKNRFTDPVASDMNSAATLTAILQPGDDSTRWTTATAAEVVGRVHDVKLGRVETVNCRASEHELRDTHIELVLAATDSAPARRVVAEITPRWRHSMALLGEDWSTTAIRQRFKGRRVRIRGWLFFDSMHSDESENTAPGRPQNWRATAWEIHPVTSIELAN